MCTYSTLIFFLYSYRAHRDLHSFPTRRSSDLAHAQPLFAPGSHEPFAMAHNGNLVDRKSTRLNSSHVRISYAVFCLKKKNKTTRLSLDFRIQLLRSKQPSPSRLCYRLLALHLR